MKFVVPPQDDGLVTFMRRAGYGFQRATESDELSFVRPLARAGYPRFHCYVREAGTRWEINLHLDQKRETYGRTTRHHGEYEDEGALRAERERLAANLESKIDIV
jgi:hypothetical protein